MSCHALLFQILITQFLKKKYSVSNPIRAMSTTNSHQSNQPDTLSKSASTSDASGDELSADEENYDNESFEDDSQDEDADFEELSLSTLERLKDIHKPTVFPNRTFTPAQIREIERENAILMNKILTYSRKPARPKSLPNKYHVTSSAINRRRAQKKIDWENQV